MSTTPDFDVALSFAGEDRSYVDRVAQALRNGGVKVFYDKFEEVNLWGKDLYQHLSYVYQKRARFTVMFISAAYGAKRWTDHERRAAQARAFEESQEYILPARFDDTEIPGVLPTVGYVSLANRSPEEFASLIIEKLVGVGGSVPTELVRMDLSAVSTLPMADAHQLEVLVLGEEEMPIADCTITAQADNGTAINGKTDASGRCFLQIKTRRLFLLLIAHPRYPAAMRDKIDPVESVKVILRRTENVGSVIMHQTGYIPGLSGRLNPILDSHRRTYLYANNIAIDGGKQQPTRFMINWPVELEDAQGTVVYVTIKHIAAGVALLQFTRRS